MTKVLRLDDDGYVWEVPAEAIAHHRATYYAENDDDTTYEDEYNFTLDSNYDIQDWFFNNMDWADVKDAAKLVETPPPRAEPRLNNGDLDSGIVERSPQETASE